MTKTNNEADTALKLLLRVSISTNASRNGFIQHSTFLDVWQQLSCTTTSVFTYTSCFPSSCDMYLPTTAYYYRTRTIQSYRHHSYRYQQLVAGLGKNSIFQILIDKYR